MVAVVTEERLASQWPLPSVQICRRGTLQRARRLHGIQEVIAELGEKVTPDTVLGWGALEGTPVIVHVASSLGCDPRDVQAHMLKQVGERVSVSTPIAERRGALGLGRKVCVSPIDGILKFGPSTRGEVLVGPDPRRVELVSHLHGRIVSISETEGAVVEVVGGCVQGVAGVGVDIHGPLRVLTETRDGEIDPSAVVATCAGAVIAGGKIGREALQRAGSHGVVGVVVGSMCCDAYWEAASMSHCPSVVITDGFGPIGMSELAFDALRSLQGETAAVFPGTADAAQSLPEVIVSVPWERGVAPAQAPILEPGSLVRLLDASNLGTVAIVLAIPSEPQRLESGLVAPVVEVELPGGAQVTVAAVNIEVVG